MLYKLQLLIALLLITLCHTSAAQDKITWGTLDFPPFEIAHGPLKNQGALDQIRGLIIAQTPNFTHAKPVLVNRDRLKKMFLDEALTACHVSSFRTAETEKNNYISLINAIANSHVILTTPERFQALGRPEHLSLQTLLTTSSLKLGMLSRSMGNKINAILEANTDNPNIVKRQSAFTSTGLIKMLYRKRIDYFIDYPEQGMYWNAANPAQPLVAIPISDVKASYAVGHVVCSRTPLGKQFIQRVNEVLRAKRETPAYIDVFAFKWIPERMKSGFIEDYLEIMAGDDWSNAEF